MYYPFEFYTVHFETSQYNGYFVHWTLFDVLPNRYYAQDYRRLLILLLFCYYYTMIIAVRELLLEVLCFLKTHFIGCWPQQFTKYF